MSINRCKACGGEMELDKNTGMAVCQYCGTKQAMSPEEKNNYVVSNEKPYAPTDKRSKLVLKIIKIALILIAAYIVIAIIVGVFLTMKYSG